MARGRKRHAYSHLGKGTRGFKEVGRGIVGKTTKSRPLGFRKPKRANKARSQGRYTV